MSKVKSSKSKRGRPAQQPLTIGVDAGCLGRQDKRVQMGVYTVSVELLKSLSKIDRKNRYILYSFSRIDKDLMKDFGTNMQNVVLPKKGWFKIWLPLALYLQKPDVFLALSQALPTTKIPTVGFIYDVTYEKYPEGYPKKFKRLQKDTRFLAQYAKKIVTVSKDSKRDIVDVYNIPQERITVSYPGVGSQFSPKGPRYIDSCPYFLYVGALRRTKNIPSLIYAFSNFLKKTQQSFRLILIGSDYWIDDKKIQDVVKKGNVENQVMFKGYIDASELPKYYRGAHALILPSRFEGFGLPLVEAMACGIPVVANKISSISEVVGDGGLLLNVEDEDQLTQVMLDIVSDEKLLKDLQKKGLQRVKQFSWVSFGRIVLREIKAACV